MFRKVLVANRGEIAVRVIRALKEMGIPSLAVYSDADRAALHVRMADEAERIGESPSSESYLRIDRVLAAAKKYGADAIHPGYGFLSENAEFAAACEGAGLTFIGPSAKSIRLMGSKTQARQLAVDAQVPVIPGTPKDVSAPAELHRLARGIGFPVMIKAAAGGGGKGMRRVDREEELDAAIRDASSEAERAFQSGEVYVEKLIEYPRHVEIQVLGDQHGNLIHLGERECSLQRRHQKVMEESPSPLTGNQPELRERMGEAAVRLAKAGGYYNAGTMEFLVDRDGKFYFLEMNTRLQVEHPVTELVTGIDLVHAQIRIAAGERLSFRQEDIRWRGSAIECRIYAEDPDNQFFPSPGEIKRLEMPDGPGVRVDSGVYEGWNVPLDYDPLLAKLVVWGEERQQAIAKLQRALDEIVVDGIKTNVEFFRRLLRDERFRRGELHTGLIAEFLKDEKAEGRGEVAEAEIVAAVVAVVSAIEDSARQQGRNAGTAQDSLSRWTMAGRRGLLRQ